MMKGWDHLLAIMTWLSFLAESGVQLVVPFPLKAPPCPFDPDLQHS